MKRVLIGAARLLVSIAICQLAGAVGLAASRDTGRYYAKLEKPSIAPPPAVFGPVWTVLYTMMGTAAYLVWRQKKADGAKALKLFGAQLALNAAWTPVFFGLKKPGLALIVIGALLPAIIATIAAFWVVSIPAALLLVPYLIWVGFASVLNFELWRRN